MFQFQLLPSLGDLTHMLFREKRRVGQEATPPSTCGEQSWAGATFRTCSRFSSLARSLWFSSRTELCWAVTSERSSLSSSFSAKVWRNHKKQQRRLWIELYTTEEDKKLNTDLVEQLCLPPEEICLLLQLLIFAALILKLALLFPKTTRHWSDQAESLLQHVTTVILIPTGTLPESMRGRRKIAHQIQASLPSFLYFMLKVFTFFSLFAQLAFLKQTHKEPVKIKMNQYIRPKKMLRMYSHFYMIRIYGVWASVEKNCCLIYTDLCLNCSEVIQSFAFFNYSKCSLHSGAAEEKKKISLFQHSHSASIKHYHGGCGGGG